MSSAACASDILSAPSQITKLSEWFTMIDFFLDPTSGLPVGTAAPLEDNPDSSDADDESSDTGDEIVGDTSVLRSTDEKE